VTKQSHQKSLIICIAIFRNKIATPFGLAMTVIFGMRTYDTRHWNTASCARDIVRTNAPSLHQDIPIQNELSYKIHFVNLGTTVLRASSFSCLSLTCDGASVIKQVAFCVFGKAIASRIDSIPQISITNLSRPSAIPP